MAIRKKVKIVKKVKVSSRKKPVKRKVVSKRKATFKRKPKPVLINACNECCFWVCDKKVLRNLAELKVALERMSNKTFTYHVNKNKNDFARWINDVLKEKALARTLKNIKSQKMFLKKIEIALKKYK